ncbi:MAG: sorbosone dehydrogenase family protein [Gammaproteobacteria bacterium]|nr:MAG: sorbosone dehydrogenase family protein [Gammaproteobacteria bacterium]
MNALYRCLALIPGLLCGISLNAQQMPPGSGVAVNPVTLNPAENLHRIKLPEGFKIEIYANNVPGARSMSLGPDGTLYVGTQSTASRENIGKVYAVRDQDGDGVAETVKVAVEGLNMPNGVAIHDGNLYVAELERLVRFDAIAKHPDKAPEPKVLDSGFGNTWMHGWKFLRFGPDGRLYMAVGSPCNNCVPDDRHGQIVRMDADGGNREVFASGVRNSVGFDWQPETGELWFTDNGRDMWGDDIPPDELNHAPNAGLHFGFPYSYGKATADKDFTPPAGLELQPAALELPPHNAAIGMRFYTGAAFPETYRKQLFIAQHGSWNSSTPVGYRVILVRIENNQAVGWEDFANGWLMEDKHYWGRPVDLEVMPDGALLVADDHAGVIYKISYGK